MSDKERVEELQRYSGLNWKELAHKLGMNTPQTFTDIRGGRHGISKGLASKILAAFPDLRQEWLVFGEGPMTKKDAANEIPLFDLSPNNPDALADANRKGSVDLGACFPKAEMAMRYTGEGMTEYPDGCVLILRRVRDVNLLVPGTDYVVETREFCVVKRLQKGHDGNHIALYSTNPATYPDGKPVYEPFEVPLEAVTRVFGIMGYIFTLSSDITPTQA